MSIDKNNIIVGALGLGAGLVYSVIRNEITKRSRSEEIMNLFNISVELAKENIDLKKQVDKNVELKELSKQMEEVLSATDEILVHVKEEA